MEEALAEWDSRVVLIIEDDDTIRNQLVELVRSLKMVAITASSGVDGLKRAKNFPPEDMIIVSAGIQDVSISYLINSFREDFRTRDIPVMITCSEAQQPKITQLYQGIAQVKGIIVTRPFVKTMVKGNISEGVRSIKSDYKSKAREVARNAVQAMATISRQSPLFNPLLDARDTLGEVLLTRHDSIRLPAIITLGNLGDSKAVPALRQLLVDKEAALNIRLNAAWALGQIFSRTKMSIDKESLAQMTSILEEKPTQQVDADPQQKLKFLTLQRVVYYLLGQANITPEQRRELFKTYRVHKTVKVVARKKAKEVIDTKPDQKEVKVKEEKPKEGEEIWGEEAWPTEEKSTQDKTKKTEKTETLDDEGFGEGGLDDEGMEEEDWGE